MSAITAAQATAKKPKRRRKKKEPAAYLLAATEQAATVNAESTFLGAMNTLINFRSFSLVALPGERAGWEAAHARPRAPPVAPSLAPPAAPGRVPADFVCVATTCVSGKRMVFQAVHLQELWASRLPLVDRYRVMPPDHMACGQRRG